MIKNRSNGFDAHKKRIESQKRAQVKINKDRLFKNCELIIRSKITSRKFRLTSQFQKIVTGVVATVMVLIILTVGFSAYQLNILGGRYQNLREARITLEEMYKDLEIIRDDFETAGRSVSDADKLRVVNDWIRGGQLDIVAKQLEEGLFYEEKPEDSFAVLATRQDFITRIDRLKKNLEHEEFEKTALSQANQQLSSRLGRTEKNYQSALEEASAFQQAVKSSQERALEAEKNNRLAEDTLTETVSSLRILTGLQGRNDVTNPVDEINAIASRLVSLHKEQNNLIERYVTSIDYLTQNIYHIVRKAGLDVDLLTSSGYLTPSVGGFQDDFDNVEGQNLVSTQRLGFSHQNLKNRLNSLEAAQRLMRCLPLSIPVENYYITSHFGPRLNPFSKDDVEQHSGLDFGSWYGKPVWATADAVVTHAERSSGFGNLIILDNGCGFKTYFAHLEKILVKKGDKVKIGDVIGQVGSTGRSSGPHLHYEIRFNKNAYDPFKFLEAGRYVYK